MESSFVVFHNPETNLKMTAKRFTLSSCLNGLTLLFAHGLDSRTSLEFICRCVYMTESTFPLLDKEQWEPLLDDLLKQQHERGHMRLVREVWTFDFQSHGEAGMLNDKVLEQRSFLSKYYASWDFST